MRHYPLTVEQLDIYLDWIENPSITQYNIAGSQIFPHNSIDKDKIENAINKLLEAVPYLYNRLIEVSEDEVPLLNQFDNPYKLIRQYPEFNQNIGLQYREISDSEADKFISYTTEPFDPFHEPMLRLDMLRTPTRDILVYNFFHMLLDGVGVKQFGNDMEALYRGEEIESQGMQFYEAAEKEYNAFDSGIYQKDKAFMEEKMQDFKHFTDICKPVKGDSKCGHSFFIEQTISMSQVDAWLMKEHCSMAELELAIFTKVLSLCTGEQDVSFMSYYHGRSALELKNPLLGMFIRPCLFRIYVDPKDDVKALIKKVKREMMFNLRHRSYPVTHYFYSHPELDISSTEVVYDGSYMTLEAKYGEYSTEWNWIDPWVSSSHLSFIIYEYNDTYYITIDCSDSLYTEERLNTFSNLFKDLLLDCVQL